MDKVSIGDAKYANKRKQSSREAFLAAAAPGEHVDAIRPRTHPFHTIHKKCAMTHDVFLDPQILSGSFINISTRYSAPAVAVTPPSANLRMRSGINR